MVVFEATVCVPVTPTPRRPSTKMNVHLNTMYPLTFVSIKENAVARQQYPMSSLKPSLLKFFSAKILVLKVLKA